jgi:hypothetical protein
MFWEFFEFLNRTILGIVLSMSRLLDRELKGIRSFKSFFIPKFTKMKQMWN